jgi:hypothetical protein
VLLSWPKVGVHLDGGARPNGRLGCCDVGLEWAAVGSSKPGGQLGQRI